MGYNTSNAAIAYDMQPQSQAGADAAAVELPGRPRLNVLTGEGRQADQVVSPAFVHVIKVACVLMMLFASVGVIRVTIASYTATTLNDNAALTSRLETDREKTSDLEVMRSVYGSSSRIRGIAVDSLGMVDPDSTVTLDLGQTAPATK